MKHFLLTVFFSFTFIILGVTTTLHIFAQTPPLSGTIFDSTNQPVSNTEITFTDPKTHKTIGKTTTGINGEYTISLPQGTYDITYAPPSGSGLSAQTLMSQSVTAEMQNNFSFSPAKNATSVHTQIPLSIFIISSVLLLALLLVGFLFWTKSKKS